MPLTYTSGVRAGAVPNMTLKEYKQGTIEGALYVVRVMDHKTKMRGGCKVMLDDEMKRRCNRYSITLGPLMLNCGEELKCDRFFLVPGGKRVDKLGNLTRILFSMLGCEIPTATTVRKCSD